MNDKIDTNSMSWLCGAFCLFASAFTSPSVASRLSVEAVSAGSDHTCAITNFTETPSLVTTTKALCWGQNIVGQLGNGTKLQALVPVQVVGLAAKPTAISAGGDHTCALLASGTVQCWGSNAWGQLGNASPQFSVGSAVPVPVTGLSNVLAISSGSYHTCALLAAHTVRCWGHNANGQLGVPASALLNSTAPVDVPELGYVSAISAGDEHTCALTPRVKAGAKCWGDNTDGQLGMGSVTLPMQPVTVDTTNIESIAAGFTDTCAGLQNGTAECWGSKALGDNTENASATPTLVALINNVTGIATGGGTRCAITWGGVMCWGNNFYGQLGNGDYDATESPVPTFSGIASEATGLTIGDRHVCAITDLGKSIHCWGDNAYGQLGSGSIAGSFTPVKVQGLDM